ncbi:hypothetical protein [Microbacterium sp. 8M]|uniref:hypothetical protein n=1 Tax=Microbacterium sp. 8M TaxID=2653153 RepID=UPI001359A786|nr:hypothetical protein [Microbacterium sp. 8M]
MSDGSRLSLSAAREARVLAALEDKSVALAGLYVQALEQLGSPAPNGREVARVSLICHCMREIMSGLPSAMAVNTRTRPNPGSASLTSKLPGLVSRHPGLDLRADQDVVPVPREFAIAVAEIIDAATKEQGIQVANAAALLTDDNDETHPLVRQWKSAQRFFLEWTHLDRNPNGTRALPDDAAIRSKMRVIEDVIEVRTALFFENLSAVQDLLAIANAAIGEESS